MPNQENERDAQRYQTTALGRFAVAGNVNPRRRVWFKEGEEDRDDPEGTPEPNSDSPERDWTGVPDWVRQQFEKAQADLKAANAESAQRRRELQQRDKTISELTAGQKKRLEEEGNFKALADQYAAENAALKMDRERAEALDKMIRESNSKRVEQIPEGMRGLVPVDYPPERLAGWLDTNWGSLTQKRAPDLDAGVTGGSGSRKGTVTLTDLERTVARASGMSDEQYAEWREKTK